VYLCVCILYERSGDSVRLVLRNLLYKLVNKLKR